MSKNFWVAFIDTILACEFARDWGYAEVLNFVGCYKSALKAGVFAPRSSRASTRARIRSCKRASARI